MNGNDVSASGSAADDGGMDEALRLDGNATGGILSEVFVPDFTTARATCANCGTSREVGALLVYAHGMGTVMRCPSCDAVVMRIAHLGTNLWLDPMGARLIVMASAGVSV